MEQITPINAVFMAGVSDTKWWCFGQNNSGGEFTHDAQAGIGYAVFVEATNKDEAFARAEDIGIYFDGVRDGIDCPCCGDRWYRSWEEGSSQPELDGEEWRAANADGEPTLEWGIPSYIHPLVGEFKVAVKGTDNTRDGGEETKGDD